MRVTPCRPQVGLWLLFAAVGITEAPAQHQKPRIPVFGVVRAAGGEPVQGATVREVRLEIEGIDHLTATRLGSGVRYGAKATTNARGKFVLMVAAHGTFGIVATTDGARSQVIAPAAPAGSHELQLRTLRTITGRFVDIENGTELPPRAHTIRSIGPIESAIPGTFPVRVLAMIDQVRTDPRGAFTVQTMVGAGCHLNDPWNTCKVDIPAEAEAPIVMRRQVRTVTGSLADGQTRAAIADYTLHLPSADAAPDDTGNFTVRLPKLQPLRISAPGYHCTQLDHKLTALTVPIPLQKAPLVTLDFKDEQGQPAAGLTVLSMDVAISGHGSSMLTRKRHTDQNGRLVVASPQEFGTSFWIQRGERFVRILELKPVAADTTRDVPTATHEVSGIVIDTDNLPAAHVAVYASPVDTAFGSRWPLAYTPVTFTDHAGRFTIQALADIPYTIAARSRTSLPSFMAALQPKNTGSLRMKLRVAPLVSGRVRDALGKPAPGIQVRARLLTLDEMPRAYGDFGIWGSTTVSDAEGRFTLPLVAEKLSHLMSINPLENLASSPQLVSEATDDLELILK